MSTILCITSFRRGVGKSNIAANLTVLLARNGYRVAVADVHFQSPSLHFLFGLHDHQHSYTLNDYLKERCRIREATYPIDLPNQAGGIFLIPASEQLRDVRALLHEGYDKSLLSLGLLELIDVLELDMLIIDTQSGLNEETLLAMALSDSLLLLLNTDQRDYEGTDVTIQMARELKISQIQLLINEAPAMFDFETIKLEISETYSCEVAAVLPHLDEMMALGSSDIFALRYPSHPMTLTLEQIAVRLVS